MIPDHERDSLHEDYGRFPGMNQLLNRIDMMDEAVHVALTAIIDPTGGGYSLGISTFGEAGYSPTNVQLSGLSHKEADHVADDINKRIFGLTERGAARVVMSSMGEQFKRELPRILEFWKQEERPYLQLNQEVLLWAEDHYSGYDNENGVGFILLPDYEIDEDEKEFFDTLIHKLPDMYHIILKAAAGDDVQEEAERLKEYVRDQG